jgi:hypothetical protein
MRILASSIFILMLIGTVTSFENVRENDLNSIVARFRMLATSSSKKQV